MLTRHTPKMGLTILLLAGLATAQSDVAQTAAAYGFSVPEYLLIERVIVAHGVVMGIAFAFMYPFGGMLIRLLAGRPWALKLHGWWQMVAIVLTIIGFGTGLWLTNVEKTWSSPTGHPIIGTIVVCLLLFMPTLGYVHHLVFVKHGCRNIFTYLHMGIGRPTLLLGGINGGLGIWMNEDVPFYSIYAYSIVAGVFYIGWIVTVIVWHTTGHRPTIEKHNDVMRDELAEMKEVDLEKNSASSSDVDEDSIEAVRVHTKDPERFPFSDR